MATLQCIGLLGSPTVKSDVLEAASGLRPAQLSQALLELRRASILTPGTRRSFEIHNLSLTVARVMANENLTSAVVIQIWEALANFMASAAYRAERRLYPQRTNLANPIMTLPDGDQADYDTSFEWFETTMDSLFALLRHVETGSRFLRHGWQVSWSVTTYLDRSGRWEDYVRSQESGLRIAARLGDDGAAAVSHRLLGTALTRLGRIEEARVHLSTALSLFDEPTEMARTTLALAFAEGAGGAFKEALKHALLAHQQYEACRDEHGIARSLSFVVAYRTRLHPTHPDNQRNIQAAIEHLKLSENLWELGHAYYHQGILLGQLGQQSKATKAFIKSARVFSQMGDKFLEARALVSAGDAAANANTRDVAVDFWARSVVLLEPFGTVFTEVIKDRLEPGKETSGSLPSPHPLP